jgi:hypothetical protein
VTYVVNALRGLTEHTGPTAKPVLYALAWSAGILVVSAMLAIWRFRKS